MTARPKPVDLTQFEGMTRGNWKWHKPHDRNCTMDITSELDDGNIVAIGTIYSILGKYGKSESNTVAIASVPDLIADLQATRDERDKLSEFVEAVENHCDKAANGGFKNPGAYEKISDHKALERVLRDESRSLLIELED